MNLLFQDANLSFQDNYESAISSWLTCKNKTEIKSFWPYCSSVHKNAVRHWPFTAATISQSLISKTQHMLKIIFFHLQNIICIFSISFVNFPIDFFKIPGRVDFTNCNPIWKPKPKIVSLRLQNMCKVVKDFLHILGEIDYTNATLFWSLVLKLSSIYW